MSVRECEVSGIFLHVRKFGDEKSSVLRVSPDFFTLHILVLKELAASQPHYLAGRTQSVGRLFWGEGVGGSTRAIPSMLMLTTLSTHISFW